MIAWNRGHQLPDGAPVDFDDLRDTTRRSYGTDFGMHDPRWTSRFHSDERQVPRYRSGRVLLAGDAAHAHSPAGPARARPLPCRTRHPRAGGGRRAPDLPLTGDGRLYEALPAGRFVLLAPAGDGVPGAWADRVDHAAAAGGERLLVRPDGYVAWSAGDGDLRAALARWCGPPA